MLAAAESLVVAAANGYNVGVGGELVLLLFVLLLLHQQRCGYDLFRFRSPPAAST